MHEESKELKIKSSIDLSPLNKQTFDVREKKVRSYTAGAHRLLE